MISIYRIQAALIRRNGEKLPAYKLAAEAGYTVKAFQAYIATIFKQGHVSREKIAGSPLGVYYYFLNDEQVRQFRAKQTLRQAKDALHGVPEEVALPAETHDIPGRLAFLGMLKEKTVFGEHRMLQLIISDYQRTLALRHAQADRVEHV